MDQLKKAGILLVLGIVIILVREYEWNQKISETPELNEKAELVRVVDGDTLILNINGKERKTRLIGINTPESVKLHSPVECFGKEASKHLSDILSTSGELRVVTDPTQDTRDQYDRLIAHVFLNDQLIAEQMLQDGYAYEYTYYGRAYIYQDAYRQAEQSARENKRGLWSTDTCNGKR